MPTYRELKLALEVLCRGSAGRIPKARRELRARADDTRDAWRALLAAETTQGVGIGERTAQGDLTGDLVLKVYVDVKRPLRELGVVAPTSASVPGLGYVPVDVEPIGMLAPQAFTSTLRPPLPGCSVSHRNYGPGTFGCVVVPDESPQQRCLLGSGHVLGNEPNVSQGDGIRQPATDDGGGVSHGIARHLRHVDLVEGDNYPNVADAAVATLDVDVDPRIRIIGDPPGSAARTWRHGEEDTVKKVGRTTSRTYGQILDVDAQVWVRQPNGKRYGFGDQVVCSRFTDDGDSGAAVLSRTGRLVGLHMAGSTGSSVFNKISNVFEALKVSLPGG